MSEESTTRDVADVMLRYVQAVQSGDADAEIRLWARDEARAAAERLAEERA